MKRIEEKRDKPCKEKKYNAGSKISINGKEFIVPEQCSITEYLPPDDGTIYYGSLLITGKKNGKEVRFSSDFNPNPLKYSEELLIARIDNWTNILIRLKNM